VTNLLRALVAGSIGFSVYFLVLLGMPWRSRHQRAVTWLLALWAGTTMAVKMLILLALFQVSVPLWVAAVVLAAEEAVFAWRVVVLRHARRADARALGG